MGYAYRIAFSLFFIWGVHRGFHASAQINSGKSPVPHLHFHMVNSSPLGEGVPYVFDSFEVQGSAESFDSLMTGGGLKKRVGAADRRSEEMPVNHAVVNFQ
jgi:hypothetical protein